MQLSTADLKFTIPRGVRTDAMLDGELVYARRRPRNPHRGEPDRHPGQA